MVDMLAFCKDFPKNFLATLLYDELGEDLWTRLENQGCQLMFSETLEKHWFTNITPALQLEVDKKKEESLEALRPEKDEYPNSMADNFRKK